MFNFSPFNFWVLITFKKFSKPLLYIQLQSVTYVQSCTRLLLFGTFELVWGNGVPISGFPWPRREFLGTRKGLWKTLGIFWGQVGLQFWFFQFLSPKIPKKIQEILGVGITFILWIFGVSPQINSYFWDSQKSFWYVNTECYAKVAEVEGVEVASNTYLILIKYSVNSHFRKIVIL